MRAYTLSRRELYVCGVKCRIEMPTLLCGSSKDTINDFIRNFVSAFEKSLADIVDENNFRSADLRTACRGFDKLFSLHFTAELENYDGSIDSYYRSFVFNIEHGTLVRLSDMTDKEFSRAHRGCSFYISDGGVVAYNVDSDGKVVKSDIGRLVLKE